MTPKDQELVYKDLCARLPYGLKIKCEKYSFPVTILYSGNIDEVKFKETGGIENICTIKPYLFPLSSMTEEQRNEFLSVAGYERREEDCGRHTETYYYDMVGHEHNFYPNSDAIDWLNKNHFDYRSLIEKSLAIDATEKGIY